MIGEASGIVPDRGMNILYRTTLNTYMNLTEDGLTQDNVGANAQTAANTRLGADTPKGILAGSIVKVGTTGGTAVKATGAADEEPLGVVINNAVGYPYESSSGVASGKVPYIHGSGTVFATDLYETYQSDGVTALTYNPGDRLYTSANGLLTVSAGAPTTTRIVGVVLQEPSASDPFMVVQMRV